MQVKQVVWKKFIVFSIVFVLTLAEFLPIAKNISFAVNDENDVEVVGYFSTDDVENEKEAAEDDGRTPLEKKIDRLEDKIDTIEDVLEIKPGFPESVEITKQELDLTPFEDKIKDNEDKDIEEEE